MITLQEITKDNLIEIIDLDVNKEQQDQVSPNSISIAQGNYSKTAWFRGIYHNEIPVGFVMLDINENECYLWRYMIDKNHQGKGYGKDALLIVIEFVKKLANIKELKSSYVPKPTYDAGDFYKKIGFIETGKLDDSTEIGIKYSIQ
jgi:diamine N-acetyltransferase